jgi:hypothetical protein
MKTTVTVFILMLAVFFSSCETVPSDQITFLPGLTYYDGKERLSGRLVFLFCNDEDRANRHNDDTCAAIYEFDLDNKHLTKLTDCPNGFLARPGENLFCVNHGLGQTSNHYSHTNEFIFSARTHQERTVTLEVVPQSTTIVRDHVFFELKGSSSATSHEFSDYYHTTNGVRIENTIVGYDFSKDQMSTVRMPGASLWEFVVYENMHRPSGQTNILHFHYKTFGKRLTTGADYSEGIYSLDVDTGDIHRISDESYDQDDERYSMTAFNGRQILFIGEEGPIAGYELISTEETHPDPRTLATEHKNINVLHSFQGYPSLTHEMNYTLHEISPDKHYVLVRKSETDKKSITGEIATYYLVDAVTGNTRVLLKDETGTIGKGAIQSSLFWLANRNE